MSTHISTAAKEVIEELWAYVDEDHLPKFDVAHALVQNAIDTETKRWRECAQTLATALKIAKLNIDNPQARGQLICEIVNPALAEFDTLNRANP